ncbi:LysR family transcriptional regulator [Nitrincola sp. MINF-07-Sa-05]|uniref:LysR family transcriptional regulator n=1 Tax=Nitrincola salilacus TaxID=3400273 RepID=UPI003917CCCB
MNITLEQWQALVAVVDHGGYAQAAEALGKSQSAISYAVQKLETSLEARVFKLKGRRSVLTDTGQALVRQARKLLEDADRIEKLARQYGAGAEAEIRIAMDAIFPSDILMCVLVEFAGLQPFTRINLLESTLSGTDEALLKGQAQLALGGRVPPGFLGTPLLTVRFIPVAHPDHPLHQMNAPLSLDDLRQHRQLVVSDSGSRNLDAGWLGAEQRWTLSSLKTSIECACQGIGFAWYPEPRIRRQLEQGLLKPLRMQISAERKVELYLILADGEFATPGVRKLAELLQKRVTEHPELNERTCPEPQI